MLNLLKHVKIINLENQESISSKSLMLIKENDIILLFNL